MHLARQALCCRTLALALRGCALAGVVGLAACGQPAAPGWSGYAEGEYVYLAPALSGTLASLAVRAGDTVAQGAPLYALDDEPEQAAQAQAQAQLAGAQAQAANADKGRRGDELAVTQAQLAQARSQATLAEAEVQRLLPLQQQGFIAPARLDDARTVAAQAQARVAELEAALRVAHLPARVDERRVAQAQADAAAQALAQARWRVQRKQQAAPVAGRVADTYFRAGEWVNAGQPVLALLPPGRVKARFFVPEGELGALKVGQPVRLQCDGCGAPIDARIGFIATQPEYTPPVIYSNAQRAKLVFLVEAWPDPAGAARLHPGQPLDVLPGGPMR